MVRVRDGAGRNRGRVVEGKHQHRNGQPQSHQKTVAVGGGGRKFRQCCAACRTRQPNGLQKITVEAEGDGRLTKNGTIPLRDKEQRKAENDRNQRIDQPVGDGENNALVEQHDANHHCQQHERDDGARGRGHVQLVFNERNHRVGDADAVNQQDGINSEEIQQGDETSAGRAEMLLYDVSDVLTGVFRRKDETGEATVRVIGHRPDDDGDDNQRPDAAHARVDGQKENARADGGTKQAERPGEVEVTEELFHGRFL